MCRLIVHHGTPPYFNMAFDEWMLSAAAGNPGAMIVRLYTWEVGTITFGHNQRCETALDLRAVGDTPVIRRVTGGRAVYHDLSELTYAIAFNTGSPPCPALSGSSGETSEAIARMLSQLMARFGVTADWVKVSDTQNSRPAYFHKAACFDSHARYELTSGRSKLVASARRDWGGAALQHGSIKLHGVAPHAALKMDGTNRHTPSKSIAITELKQASIALSATIGEQFGVKINERPLSSAACEWISTRASLIEKSPLDRRDLIAQSLPLFSL